jgi:hypothetical protein
MLSIKKRLLCSMVIVSLVLIPVVSTVFAGNPVEVQEKTAEGMAIDLVLLRPLGLVATVAGSVVHVVGLIFSSAGGNAGEAAELLVKEPAKFTFARPLGEF